MNWFAFRAWFQSGRETEWTFRPWQGFLWFVGLSILGRVLLHPLAIILDPLVVLSGPIDFGYLIGKLVVLFAVWLSMEAKSA